MPARRTDSEFGGRGGRTPPMEFVTTPELEAADRARLMREVGATKQDTEEQVRAAEERRANAADKVGR